MWTVRSAFAAGVLVGIVGTTAGLVVGAVGQHAWDAAEALAAIFAGAATLAAVWVALLPIWETRRRREVQAQLLRIRVLNHLHMLEEAFGVLSKKRPVVRVGPPFQPHLEDAIRGILKDIKALEALYPQAELLDADSFDALVQLLPNLVRVGRIATRAAKEGRPLEPQQARGFMEMTRAAFERIESGGPLLHGEPVPQTPPTDAKPPAPEREPERV